MSPAKERLYFRRLSLTPQLCMASFLCSDSLFIVFKFINVGTTQPPTCHVAISALPSFDTSAFFLAQAAMAMNEEILKTLKDFSKDLGLLCSDVDSLMRQSNTSDRRSRAREDIP